MRSKRSAKKAAKTPRRVQWEPEVTLWMVGLGMLFGFGAEVCWDGSFLWMSEGGFIGGLAGAICDTALFLYRRCRQKRKSPALYH